MVNDYLFNYILETRELGNPSEANSVEAIYGVRYMRTEKGAIVEVGDGLRHTNYFSKKHWNRLLKIIQEDELDESGLDLILENFMRKGLNHGEHKGSFLHGVKEGIIKII
jgi:hypothetical protein